MRPVVVVGMGVVGQATARLLLRSGYDVTGVDVLPRLRIKRWIPSDYRSRIHWTRELPLINRAIYVLCLPTPTEVSDPDGAWGTSGGFQDDHAIRQTLLALRNQACTVILRSTVLPANFNLPAYDRVDYTWPEFLHMDRIIRDSDWPEYHVWGCRPSPDNLVEGFPLRLKYRGSPKKYPRREIWVTREQAMAIKYLHNAWNALRISFVNEMYDTMEIQGVQASDFLIHWYFENADYLKPGDPFAGACLPKDAAAWVGAARHRAVMMDATLYSNYLHGIKGQYIPLRLPNPPAEPQTHAIVAENVIGTLALPSPSSDMS